MKYEQIAKEKFEKLKDKEIVRVLAIESSCDETSVAIVENGRTLLSNTIATQIEIHKRFGGVVPEVASRNHILAISNVTKESLNEAGLTFKDIDAIAVTYGAGLLGALLVGVNFAKSLAYSLELPLIKVSHVSGHISANYISHKDLKPPFACLMVSGGHTCILDVTGYTNFKIIGGTVDDSVGEGFDKVARVLGLSYPGGPIVDKLAKQGNANIVFTHKNSLKNEYNFSFSGIKTAVINYVHTKKQKGEEINIPDVCASYQTAVVNELITKLVRYAEEKQIKKLAVCGGVSANSFLKQELNKLANDKGIELYMPELKLCTDNAAMIASQAYFMIKEGKGLADLTLSARPTIDLKEFE